MLFGSRELARGLDGLQRRPEAAAERAALGKALRVLRRARVRRFRPIAIGLS